MAEAQPAASIVLPVLDDAKDLEAWLDSVPSWNLPVELVVVDGGSRDGSRERAHEASERHPRIRVLHEEDHPGPRSLPHGRNVGLAAARAPVVLLVDADYRFDEVQVQEILRAAHKDGYAVAPMQNDRSTPAARFQNPHWGDRQLVALREPGPEVRFDERLGYGEDRDFWAHTVGFPLPPPNVGRPIRRGLPSTTRLFLRQHAWYARTMPVFLTKAARARDPALSRSAASGTTTLLAHTVTVAGLAGAVAAVVLRLPLLAVVLTLPAWTLPLRSAVRQARLGGLKEAPYAFTLRAFLPFHFLYHLFRGILQRRVRLSR